ncbi:MAG: regulatory protein RecX [Flavobacteriaceae bacterium]
MNSKSFTYKEALAKLEHYCAYQERCHQEVTRKLQTMGMIPEVRDMIISQLIQNNYLNETRFAQAYARGKFRIKRWGRLRITRELKNRRISDWNIQKALTEIPEQDYQQQLEALVEEFWNKNEKHPYWNRKQKVLQAMQYRGWEMDLVQQVLSRFKNDS